MWTGLHHLALWYHWALPAFFSTSWSCLTALLLFKEQVKYIPFDDSLFLYLFDFELQGKEQKKTLKNTLLFVYTIMLSRNSMVFFFCII